MSCPNPQGEQAQSSSAASNGSGDSHDGSAHDDLMSFVATGNATPILHEIKHALSALLERGEESVIDLGAIPFAPGDERELAQALGTGEVACVVNVLGETQVYETDIAGVWRVDHLDDEGGYQSRFIEITFTPEILKTQREDAEAGLERLAERLDALGG